MITKKGIVTLSRRRAGRHAVKPCGTQEKASAGLAWGGVFGSVRAMALTGVWAARNRKKAAGEGMFEGGADVEAMLGGGGGRGARATHPPEIVVGLGRRNPNEARPGRR